jgi:hypothetical protein
VPRVRQSETSGRDEQRPPPVYVLIFEPLLVAEMGVQRARYVCRPATACSAAASAGGSSFPRFAARRRIPSQARGLK